MPIFPGPYTQTDMISRQVRQLPPTNHYPRNKPRHTISQHQIAAATKQQQRHRVMFQPLLQLLQLISGMNFSVVLSHCWQPERIQGLQGIFSPEL
jgi:hypothetical protein